MAKETFLMLAHVYDPKKHKLAGKYASEKLDGVRCLWDAGASRGIPCVQVPWANTLKHDRFVEQKTATGLWTRYGQPVLAPDWFLDSLPRILIDGELYAGRNSFQTLTSIVKTQTGEDKGWSSVKLMAFGSPNPYSLFYDRKINETNFKKQLVNCVEFFNSKIKGHNGFVKFGETFVEEINLLKSFRGMDKSTQDTWRVHEQFLLPSIEGEAMAEVQKRLEVIENGGGEGLIIRPKWGRWIPERTHDLLKIKSYKDAEAKVIGFNFGKRTDKDSKHLGKMGSLRCILSNGTEFDVSGFTDNERLLSLSPYGSSPIPADRVADFACEHEGNYAPNFIECTAFPRNSVITFKYRELSDIGVPKEASYVRKQVD